MARRFKSQGVKRLRSYTIEEAAEAVGASDQTIRQWIRNGLPAFTEKRPFLIMGSDLKAWLSKGADAIRPKLEIGEFYCLRCKKAVKSAVGAADYRPLSDTHGMLTSFCARCEGPCSRITSGSALSDWGAVLEIGGSTPPHP